MEALVYAAALVVLALAVDFGLSYASIEVKQVDTLPFVK